MKNMILCVTVAVLLGCAGVIEWQYLIEGTGKQRPDLPDVNKTIRRAGYPFNWSWVRPTHSNHPTNPFSFEQAPLIWLDYGENSADWHHRLNGKPTGTELTLMRQHLARRCLRTDGLPLTVRCH
ncbi:hypothetical protein [Enterobacter hormaechei]|uniref:hypothetical protein n=1 Tax=Enterobacter hormaechei TaxID=158836 RepID=UPI00388F7473